MTNIQLLKKKLDQIDIFSFEDLRSCFTALYQEVKNEKKNIRETYSYRKYSADLGFGETNYFHLICTGKRKLTKSAIKTVSETLSLKVGEYDYLISLNELERSSDTDKYEAALSKVYYLRQKKLAKSASEGEAKESFSAMEYLGKWYIPVIRELVGTKDFEEDPFWLAEKINPRVRAAELRDGLKALEKLGFLERDENGKLIQSEKNIQIPSTFRNLTIQKYHQEMLELSRKLLKEPNNKSKDFQALTIPCSEALMEEYKREMHKLLGKFMAKSSETPESDRILQLNMQMFLVTND